jgi:lipopolysaccharide biosynthesis protein
MQDVCLFAHFDQDDKVDDYVLGYLAQLRESNFSIVFISTSRLSAAETARLRDTCCDVILRENAGLDFASWSAGFAKHASAIGGRLLLANDSVYGPIGSLKTALERLTLNHADFYGMVESVEIAPHLQSWFVLLEPWVVRSAAFSAILAQPFAGMTRKQIVLNGEVDLSRRLMQAGFHYQALHRNDRIGLPGRHDANAMLLFWRELLLEEGIPFLKIELLRDNPIGVEDAATILQSVERIDPAICDLISLHLARTGGADKPSHRERSAVAQYRYRLMRRYDQNRREKRHTAAALTRLQLEILAFPVAAWRRLRSLLAPDHGDA